jgi:hypothetical protein
MDNKARKDQWGTTRVRSEAFEEGNGEENEYKPKSSKKKRKGKKSNNITIQQLDNTFERASTLDEKRLAAVQMIQSGLLPTPWQQLISWMIQKHVKRQLVE